MIRAYKGNFCSNIYSNKFINGKVVIYIDNDIVKIFFTYKGIYRHGRIDKYYGSMIENIIESKDLKIKIISLTKIEMICKYKNMFPYDKGYFKLIRLY